MASGSYYDAPFSEVKLYYSCTELKGEDRWYGQLYDRHFPFAVLYEWDESMAADLVGTGWIKVGHTDADYSNFDPKVFACIIISESICTCDV